MLLSFLQAPVVRVSTEDVDHLNDQVATEEPLEIRLQFTKDGTILQKSISVTMRTPGHDFDLATGFLFTEGIVSDVGDIVSIKHCGQKENVVKVALKPDLAIEVGKLERNFYTTSSCGVCGKSSLEAVKTVCKRTTEATPLRIDGELLYSLPIILKDSQQVFAQTGGIHGCGLFSTTGELIICREDVGRHNALDKLIGAMLTQQHALARSILLLSGRASFELIQKAYMAGIQVVAAVGAPSSLAIEMANEAGITLVGFLKSRSFNIYTGTHRIIIKHYENSYQG